MLSRIKKNKNLQAWLVMGFSISFMMCIFAPIDVYYANMGEYWFSLGLLLSVSIIPFILINIFMFIIGCLISTKKVFGVLFVSLTGLFIYLYIQGNYIPRNYGVLNGKEVDWSAYSGYAIASVVLIILCIIFVLIVLKKFKEYILKIGMIVAAFVFLIQLVTIGILVVRNGTNNMDEVVVSTDKDYFDYSKDNNIVVFLLDSYDGRDFDYLLTNDYDYQAQIFKDFTFYKDTLGAYSTTKGSLPFILTGEWYENNEPYSQYIDNAYKSNSIYKAFEENEYELDLYVPTNYISDELDYFNKEKGTYTISNIPQFLKDVYSLVAFNYMPHQLKKFFYIDSASFAKLRKVNTTYPEYSFDMIQVVENFDNSGLSVKKNGNVFKFYYLEGVHPPYTFGKDLQEDGGSYTSYDEAAGSNEYLKKVFDEMKKKGVYDNSTIIVMADHGYGGYYQNPAFFIKNANESHDFVVSNESMSWAYLSEIWEALANGKIVDESFIHLCNKDSNIRRFLFYLAEHREPDECLYALLEMYCDGKAYNTDDMHNTGKVYSYDSQNYKYELGSRIDFDERGNGYCLYGFANYVRQRAAMRFDISGKYNNLLVKMNTYDNMSSDVVSVYANDNLVAQLPYSQDVKFLEFVVPSNYVKDGVLELRFERGDETNYNSAYVDSNLRIQSMVIESTDNEFSLDAQRQVVAD